MRPSTTSICEKTSVVGKFGLLRLRGLVRVRSKGTDIDEADYAIVGSGAGDDGSAVRVADKNNRAADPADRRFRYGNILCC
jgi:hypothetical protein